MSTRAEYLKTYQQEHKAAAAARAKLWRSRHPEQVRAARKLNQEKRTEYNRVWFSKHPGYCASKAKLWRDSNPFEAKAAHDKYKAANPEKVRESSRLAKINHPETTKAAYLRRMSNPSSYARKLADNNKRRALKMLATTEDCSKYEEAIRTSEVVACIWCGKLLSGSTVHLDHVIPLSRGGSHSKTNLKPSCPSCNLRKNASMPAEFETRLLTEKNKEAYLGCYH